MVRFSSGKDMTAQHHYEHFFCAHYMYLVGDIPAADPFDPEESEFDLFALCRLDAAGMDGGKKLCDHDVVGRLQWEPRTAQPESDPFTDAMRYWVKGMQKGYPPTWTTLFKVLRELDLQELSKQVEEFLTRMLGLNSSNSCVGLGIRHHFAMETVAILVHISLSFVHQNGCHGSRYAVTALLPRLESPHGSSS